MSTRGVLVAVGLIAGVVLLAPKKVVGDCWDCEIANPDCIGCGAPGGVGYCMTNCTDSHGGGTESCTLTGEHCHGAGSFRSGDAGLDGSATMPPWVVAYAAAGRTVTDCRGFVVSRGWSTSQAQRVRRDTATLTL